MENIVLVLAEPEERLPKANPRVEKLLQDFEWAAPYFEANRLHEYVTKQSKTADKKDGHHDPHGDEDRHRVEYELPTESSMLEQIYEDMRNADALDAEVNANEGTTHFILKHQKGESTLRVSGVAVDSLRGTGRQVQHRNWCKHYNMQESVTAYFSQYSHEEAVMLCSLYCHRMQFFYELWQERGSNMGYKFTDADRASYNEPDRYQDFFGRLTGQIVQKAQKVRRLFPR